jgi:hypothetical protein
LVLDIDEAVTVVANVIVVISDNYFDILYRSVTNWYNSVADGGRREPKFIVF